MRRLPGEMIYVMAVLLLISSANVVARGNSGVALQFEAGAERLHLEFIWDAPVTVHQEVDGRELVLRFSRPIPPKLLADVTARNRAWIDWSSTGYDSLLIHAAREVLYRVVAEDDRHISVDLIFRPEAVQAGKPAEKRTSQRSETAALRLERLRALWLAETGRLFAARRKFARLHEQYPGDSELLPEMAGIEARLGQWQQAVSYYNQALEAGRETPQVVAAKAGLLYDYGPQLRLSTDWQQIHKADWQQISRLSGRENIGDRTELGFVWEHRLIRDGKLRRIAGPIGPFRGERNYFQLHLQRHFDWAAYTRWTLTGGNENAVGLRGEYSQRLDTARVWVDANYHAPAWQYVEGVVDGGTVDSLTVGWERPGRDGWRTPEEDALSTYISASVRNYGVEDDNSVAASYALKLGARLLLQEMAPQLSVGYGLDLEERTSVDTRRYAGVGYHPYPMVSRQVHRVDVMWLDRLGDYLRYEAGGGASYDPRNDAGGPFVTANLAWEPRLGLEAGVRFMHSAGPYRGQYARYTLAGAYLLWHFW